jgi:VanZ family protein
VLPFAVFVGFLALWTYELLAENPVPESVSRAIPNEWKFWLAKGLHVAAYAFLTVLAGLLPVPRLVFWLVVALLVLHGIATEVGQTFVAGRHGSLRDVVLDWVGVGLGLLVLGLLRTMRNPGRRR